MKGMYCEVSKIASQERLKTPKHTMNDENPEW